MPIRIQRSRRKGWKMPAGAIYVGRPTKWGNPFLAAEAHETYRRWLKFIQYGSAESALNATLNEIQFAAARRRWILDNLETLRGHDLCCWCSEGSACHGDVLLEMANR